jgi:hypothetical protein
MLIDPWEHVVGMGLGVVFVNQLVKWDAQLEQDLDKMLLKAKEANERRYFGTLSFSYLDHIFLLQQFFFSGFALFFLISSSFSLGPRFLLLKFGFFFFFNVVDNWRYQFEKTSVFVMMD